jgi:hypothetical protein
MGPSLYGRPVPRMLLGNTYPALRSGGVWACTVTLPYRTPTPYYTTGPPVTHHHTLRVQANRYTTGMVVLRIPYAGHGGLYSPGASSGIPLVFTHTHDTYIDIIVLDVRNGPVFPGR